MLTIPPRSIYGRVSDENGSGLERSSVTDEKRSDSHALLRQPTSPRPVIRIRRFWDEALFQTAASRPARSAVVLLTWTMDPPPVDAGVPPPVIEIVSQVAASLGAAAFRLFYPEDLPAGLRRVPSARPLLPVRIYQRLTRTWPAEIAIAMDATAVAELFLQDWEMQGQTALVLRTGSPTDETLGHLGRLRDWRGVDFPADARLLIAPAVDGDGILFAAASARELTDILDTLQQTFERAGLIVWGDATERDLPAMEVAISHHIDASEPDAEGFHEYHYEYDIYEFSRAGRSYAARSYIDTADRAAFLSRLEGGQERLLEPADLVDPLLVEAVDYLHAAGKTKLDRLTKTEGYVPLEVTAAPSRA